MEKIIEAPKNEKLIKKSHDNKWIAISADYKKVFASATTLSAILKKTSSEKRVMVFKAPPVY